MKKGCVVIQKTWKGYLERKKYERVSYWYYLFFKVLLFIITPFQVTKKTRRTFSLREYTGKNLSKQSRDPNDA